MRVLSGQAADHGFRLDQQEWLLPVSPDSRQKDPEQAVAIADVGAFAAAGEDVQLVAQGQVLEDEVLPC